MKKLISIALSLLLCLSLGLNSFAYTQVENLEEEIVADRPIDLGNGVAITQISIEYDEDGNLIKEVSKIGEVYFYKSKSANGIVMFQVTPKDFYSITKAVNDIAYNANDFQEGIYANICLDPETKLDEMFNQIINEQNEFVFIQFEQPQVYIARAPQYVHNEVISECNKAWGGEGNQYIAGGGRYVSGIQYTYSIYLSNLRNFGELYRLQITAGTLFDKLVFLANMPESLIYAAISVVLDGPSGAIKAVKDFTCEKMLVENISNKNVYVNNQSNNSYWAGWDSKLQFLKGDIGWKANANFSYDYMHSDFKNHDALIDRAISNYINSN